MPRVSCVCLRCSFFLRSSFWCAACRLLSFASNFVLPTNGKAETKQRQQPYDYMDIAILHLSIHFISFRPKCYFMCSNSSSNSHEYEPESLIEQWFRLLCMPHYITHAFFLYVYLYAFYISNHNQHSMCRSLSPSLFLPSHSFPYSCACLIILSLFHSFVYIGVHCFCFTLKFRSGSFLSFLFTSPYVSFSSNSTQF